MKAYPTIYIPHRTLNNLHTTSDLKQTRPTPSVTLHSNLTLHLKLNNSDKHNLPDASQPEEEEKKEREEQGSKGDVGEEGGYGVEKGESVDAEIKTYMHTHARAGDAGGAVAPAKTFLEMQRERKRQHKVPKLYTLNLLL